MNWPTIIVLIAIAVALIAVDFYLPGFVLASLGTILMIIAVVMAFVIAGLGAAAWTLVAVVILGFAAAYFSSKYVPQTALGKRMFLHETQSGVRAQTEIAPQMVGKTGVARTVLRPSGVVEVDGKRLDVVAESGMIPSGELIVIAAVQENRIIVRKA